LRGVTETIKSEQVRGDNMARGSGSKRCVELAYNYVQSLDKKKATTIEIMDYINNRKVTTGCRATKETWSVNQVSQILKKSAYFKTIGKANRRSPSGNYSPCNIYACIPCEIVVAKLLSYKHRIHTYKAVPKFAKEEYARQEALLHEN